MIVQVSTSTDPHFPNAPWVGDFLTIEADRQALAFFTAPDDIQYPYMLPPGASRNLVQIYRQAFDRPVKDPAYLTEAKQRRQDIAPYTGSDVQKIVEGIYQTPKNVIERVMRATTPVSR